MLAYYFPPVGGIGSIRSARFAEYLPEFRWEPIVLAPSNTPHARDDGLRFAEERVVRSRSIEMSRLGKAVPRIGGEESTGSQDLRGIVRRVAHRRLFYPDAQLGWYPGAVAAGLRTLRRTPVDVVYSSSFPITAHLVARTLSRHAKVPWVAEFRDPWSEALPEGHPHRRRAAALETAISQEASRVIMLTPTWAEHFGARWARKIDVLPNGHDLDGTPSRSPDEPVLTHVGTFYPGRQDLRALWEALAQLDRSVSVSAPRIRFIGELPTEVRAELSSYGLEHLLEERGFVPHDEAMRLALASTMLFASGVARRDMLGRGCVPAKLAEYLATELPVLYLGDRAGDAAKLLSGQPGCHVVEPTDVAGALAAVKAGLDGARHRREVEHLSRRTLTGSLAEIFEQATAR